nr:laccase [Dimocarpus longan]
MGLVSRFLWLMLLGCLLYCEAEGAVHYYDFVVKETNFTRLCQTKSMLTVNDSFPGPEIRVQKGDTAFVTVYNQGPYGITIHWHGVKMPRNPWSDGPEYVTQCPIPAGSNFTQEINFSIEEGTIWWHAHSDWSRATVHGAILVYPANGTTYPYPEPDGQQTIVLASWYNADVMEVYEEAVTSGSEFNTSDAFTINGQPGALYDCSTGTTFRMNVTSGKTYLLRIINAILNEEMFFGIANHNLTVVGTDGFYTKPINVEYIFITPGQTMDVLVTANQTASYYYMAASPFSDSEAEFDNSTTTALFQYIGNETVPDPIPFPSLPSYNDSGPPYGFLLRLRSLADAAHPVSVPTNITKHIYMTASVNLIVCPYNNCSGSTDGDRLGASLNNQSFDFPSIDILQAYYKNISGVFTTDFPLEPPIYFNFTAVEVNVTVYTGQGTKVIELDYGDEVELVFQGTNVGNAQNHPMHLHGYSFYLLGLGFGNFDNSTDPLTYNLVDPLELNTIQLSKRGWVAIRFKADNPGVWLMHCHYERHTAWGMAAVFIVKDGGTTNTSMRAPPASMPICASS